MKKSWIAALTVTALASLILASCSSADHSGGSYAASPSYYDDGMYESWEDYNYAEEYAPAEAEYYSDKPAAAAQSIASGVSSSAPVNTDPNRKIVYTVNLDLETRDFDSAADQVYAICSELGGYVESSSISGSSLNYSGGYYYRNASFTLRVPAQNLDSAVGKFEGAFNVVSSNRYSEDITSSYYDVDARLKSLSEEEQRLLEMLEGADELQYMIQIEDKLSDIRYQIETYYSRLQRMDSSVNYSTLNISISEVHNYNVVAHPISFGERITTAFKDSWAGFAEGVQDFCVWFVEVFPALLVLALIIFIIVIIIRAIVKRSRNKKIKRASVGYPIPPYPAAAQPTMQSGASSDSKTGGPDNINEKK